MVGKLTESQFEKWKKAEIVKLAEQLGVSTDGTAKEIVERICEVEVGVPDEAELTPEEVLLVREAEAEAEAQAEAEKAEKESAGKKGVRCIARFIDIQTDQIRELGEEWDADIERAEYLRDKGFVELI